MNEDWCVCREKKNVAGAEMVCVQLCCGTAMCREKKNLVMWKSEGDFRIWKFFKIKGSSCPFNF